MRNVMAQWVTVAFYVTLAIGFSNISAVIGNTRRPFLSIWENPIENSGPDDWQPLIIEKRSQNVYSASNELQPAINFPTNQNSRDLQSYSSVLTSTPSRNLEENEDNNQFIQKKSYQVITASSPNNLDPMTAPSILGAFNSIGLRMVQTRVPIIDKPIKINPISQHHHHHPHYQNYHHHHSYKSPSFISAQLTPNGNAFLSRQEIFNQNSRYQPLIVSSPTRTTSVQIFPPRPSPSQNLYHQVGHNPSQNLDNLNSFRKHTENSYLNTPAIYGTRDTFNLPTVYKPTPFSKNQQFEEYTFVTNKAAAAEDDTGPNSFDSGINSFQTGIGIDSRQTILNRKIPYEEKNLGNPGKQVFEQLSKYGKPFSFQTDKREPLRVVQEFSYPSNPSPTIKSGKFAIHTNNFKADKSSQPQYIPLFDNTNPQSDSDNPNYIIHVSSPPILTDSADYSYINNMRDTPEGEEGLPPKLQKQKNKFRTRVKDNPIPFLPTPTNGYDSVENDSHGFTTSNHYTIPTNHKYSNHQGFRSPDSDDSSRIRYSEIITTPESINDQTDYFTQEYTTMKVKSKKRKPRPTTTVTVPSYEDIITNSPDLGNFEVIKSNPRRKKKPHTQKPEEFLEITTLPPNEPIEYVPNENGGGHVKIQYGQLQTEDGFDSFISAATTTTPTTTPVAESPTTTTTTTIKPRPKFGSERPKFSIKEYRTRSSTSTSTEIAPEEVASEDLKKTTRKSLLSIRTESDKSTPSRTDRFPVERKRPYVKNETRGDQETSSEQSLRKYRPRIRPSRYKTNTTTTSSTVAVLPILETSTLSASSTERINTFRPTGASRYKFGGKVVSKYRTTSTESYSGNELNDSSPSSSLKHSVTVPKPLFSAKRQALPRLSTTTTTIEYKDVEEDVTENPKAYRKPYKGITKTAEEKLDDESNITVMNSLEEIQLQKNINHTKNNINITNDNDDNNNNNNSFEYYEVDDDDDIDDNKQSNNSSSIFSSPTKMSEHVGNLTSASNFSSSNIKSSSMSRNAPSHYLNDDSMPPVDAFFRSWMNNQKHKIE